MGVSDLDFPHMFFKKILQTPVLAKNFFLCSNIALCYLKKRDYQNSLEAALAAMEMMPEYFRSYERCSDAFMGLVSTLNIKAVLPSRTIFLRLRLCLQIFFFSRSGSR